MVKVLENSSEIRSSSNIRAAVEDESRAFLYPIKGSTESMIKTTVFFYYNLETRVEMAINGPTLIINQ